ncbi:MAG: hypothetical protein ABIQ90_17600 [Polaromonas sp.]
MPDIVKQTGAQSLEGKCRWRSLVLRGLRPMSAYRAQCVIYSAKARKQIFAFDFSTVLQAFLGAAGQKTGIPHEK